MIARAGAADADVAIGTRGPRRQPDGLIDRNELGSFLATLTDAVGGESPTAYGVRSGVANALVTQTRPIDTRASTTAGDRGVVSHQAWSWSPAGEKVTFSYQLPADYRYEQGAFRHVMPGFIHDRMPTGKTTRR